MSERAFRALFNGRRMIPSNNPAMVERRKARFRGKNSGRRMPGQRRAYQALNVMGLRIWVNKPRQFGGYQWRARRATVARSIALREFQDSREWQREGKPAFSKRRGAHEKGVDLLAITGGGVCRNWGFGWLGEIDAPELMAAGGMYDFDPVPFADKSCEGLLFRRGAK